MDQTIEEKTRALCQAIVSQPGFSTAQKNLSRFMEDTAAQSQYRQLTEKGQQLQKKQSQGTPIDHEEISAFEQEREKFINNPVARGFIDAQEEMHQLQETVNQYVMKTFELGRLPEANDFEQGSCGEGCGCHH